MLKQRSQTNRQHVTANTARLQRETGAAGELRRPETEDSTNIYLHSSFNVPDAVPEKVFALVLFTVWMLFLNSTEK